MISFDKYFLVIILCLGGLIVEAQTFLDWQKKYPKSKELYLSRKNTTVIKVKKGELSIYEDLYEEKIYLKKPSNVRTKNQVSFNSFNEITDLKASVFVLKDGKYKEYKVSDFKTKKEISGGFVFHDDTKTINYYFDKLAEGTKTRESYRSIIKEPRFLGGFFFAEYVPIDYAEYTIIAPKSVKLNFHEFHTEGKDIQFTQTEKKGIVTYKWVRRNIQPVRYESQTPGFRYFLPHIYPAIASYTIEGKTTELLNSVDNLYNWYYSLTEKVNQEEDEHLKQVADSLTKNAPDELTKVKNIFYWVQDNIRYIAFEDGLGGFIPREGKAIFHKRYGDCKDMASIITYMLRLVNIPSYLTWIGSDGIPYSYDELPTPSVDNHMIATYFDGDKPYFLDATGSYIPIGYSTPFIQGKEALVGLGKGKYKLITVPTPEAEYNKLYEKIHISLNDMTVKGRSDCEVSGFQKLRLSESLGGKDDKEMKDFFISFCNKGDNTLLIQDYKEKDLKYRDLPYSVSYDFTIQNHVHKHEDELYINMHLMKFFEKTKIKKDRENMIKNRYHAQYGYEVVFDIPQGYAISEIPENQKYQHKLFDFSSEYEQKGDQLVLRFKFNNRYRFMKKENFDDWNQMLKVLKSSYNETLILKKN